MTLEISRREWLVGGTAAIGGSLIGSATARSSEDAQAGAKDEPFGYCLNTSTIRGPELTIVQKIEIAAEAGYRGLEPWVRELDQYAKEGGSLKELGKRIRDAGLSVESAIDFSEWIVDDDSRRKKALEAAQRSMEMVAEIGGKRIAAPPVGATKQSDVNLRAAAERYHALLELGSRAGVVPQVEVWGFSQTLGRLGEAVLVAIESGHRRACILPDVYHLYKGGSNFDGLKLLSGAAFHVFHFNDYPAAPPRSEMSDAHRVYPGDGIAPLEEIVRTLREIGFRGMLSLELFNREYWKQDPRTVARTGLEKMRAVVRRSLG